MTRGGADGGGPPDEDPSPAGRGPTVGEFHRLLGARSRRRVLYFLQEHGSVPLRELGDVLAGWQAVADGVVVGLAERHRIETALHHAEVPRLADADVVAYDRERRAVSLEPLAAPLQEVLRQTRIYESAAGPVEAVGSRRIGDRDVSDGREGRNGRDDRDDREDRDGSSDRGPTP